ncbi:RNA-binding (RRM/RBD/RNP motif) family protein [Forsythia ovata]|uniref:RNA-binding (RRM/RBD/RNP motif) family protein n=1 Tax=Forsythia ovata TaxID=205694 RepID=A0ABD1P4R7_9LAMI
MSEKIRIYVGGLGLSVKEDDLKKTFTSPQLGTVDSVEIMRTKGRSFAYLDFVPVSDKGLAKLFSMYNGCMWRGGKLRLEKAREHYLVRLKREWDDDVELAVNLPSQNVDAAETVRSSEKPRKDPNMEKLQLRIFFPKLRKIKPLPFKGTGKHKYSFQRIEVPPLPAHFCDCEEHSGHPEIVKENASKYGTENFGVNQEELDMMKSVVNKILEKENCSNATCTNAGYIMEVNNSAALLNNVQVDDDGDDQMSDEDNLIINMVAGPDNRIAFFKDWRQEAANADWDSILKEPKTSNDRRPREMHGSQKRNAVVSKKKRRTPFGEDDRNHVSARKRMKGSPDIVVNDSNTDVNTQPEEAESGSAHLNHDASPSQKSDYMVSEKSSTALHSGNSTSHGPEVAEQQSLTVPGFTDKENQSSQVKELEKITDVLSDKPRATVDKSARGASWLQKSSWTQLVGDTHNSSFSISQVLPGVTFEKQELPQINNFVFSRNNKLHKSFEKDTSYSVQQVSKPRGGANKDFATAADKFDVDALTRKEQSHDDLNGEQSSPEIKKKIVKDNEAPTSTLGQNVPSALNRPSLGDIVTSEACPFMRSAASMKEWTKTKAALSGSFKKKGNEK